MKRLLIENQEHVDESQRRQVQLDNLAAEVELLDKEFDLEKEKLATKLSEVEETTQSNRVRCTTYFVCLSRNDVTF